MPAAAVVGAATAFGLASLLPLNVPVNKPLMYCNTTDIAQTQIKFEGNIYFCANNSIAISCPRSVLSDNTTFDECLSENKTLQCDLKDNVENVYCTNGTLLNREATMCNSTTMLNGTNANETTPILNCYLGFLPDQQASFIPSLTTEAPITTTEKQSSFGADLYSYFLKIFSENDDLEEASVSESSEEYDFMPNTKAAWVPVALAMPLLTLLPTPPKENPSTTTTEGPFMYAFKVPYQFENGTWGTIYKEIDKLHLKFIVSTKDRFGGRMPDFVEKVKITATENPNDASLKSKEIESSTESSLLGFNVLQ